MTRAGRAGIACLLATSLLATTAHHTTAQNPPGRDLTRVPSRTDTRGWLPAHHWTRAAISRLGAAGLLPAGYTNLAWPASRAIIRDLLAVAATATDHPEAERAGAWLARFDTEFRSWGTQNIAAVTPAVGFTSRHGELRGGLTTTSPGGPVYNGPISINDVTEVFGEMGVSAGIGDNFGVVWDLQAGSEVGVETARATVFGRFGHAELWAGRREAGFGPSPDGIVLSGSIPFDGAGIDTPAGFRLPWFLDALGTVRVNAVVSRFERSGPVARPWFVASRISFSPSRAVSFGLNRAALFGGEGNEPVTVGRLLLVLFGITDSGVKDSDFENQVASVDLTWRPGRSVLVWAEYGFDDAGTAFVLVPGLNAGLLWSGLGDWSVGGSVTGLASSCCDHPAWYVHAALAEGWTDRGDLLGHPVGGNGLELAALTAWDPIASSLLARARIFVRDRGSENLFSPDRHGSTAGIELSFQVRLAGMRVETTVEAEAGAGPDRWRTEVRVGS